MRATMNAKAFRNIIHNTKLFTGNNDITRYIRLEITATTELVKATALDGHKVSIECEHIVSADEDFVCYVIPFVFRAPRDVEYVELEVVDGKLLIHVGESIYGFKQPQGMLPDIAGKRKTDTTNGQKSGQLRRDRDGNKI